MGNEAPTIRICSVQEFRNYLPLMQEAWKEVDPRESRLNPDFDEMQRLEEAGQYQVYLIEDKEEVVGYWAIALSANFFVKGELTAVNVSLYIQPPYRSIWSDLLDTVIKDVKEAEATDFIINLKRQNKIIEEKGFIEAETVYWRSI